MMRARRYTGLDIYGGRAVGMSAQWRCRWPTHDPPCGVRYLPLGIASAPNNAQVIDNNHRYWRR